MPSLLFVTDNFPPENNAPSYRTHAHCIVWKNLGWDVTVLTSVPNAPKGKVFNGFKNKFFQFGMSEGIRVYRTWTFVAPNAGFYLRILDYISFLFSSILASIFIKRHEFVISTSPQFFAGLSGMFISKIHRAKWVLELRDLWPESIISVGHFSKKSRIYKILFKLALFMYQRSDKIIVVTDRTKQILISYGVKSTKIIVARNGIEKKDIEFFSKMSRSSCCDIVDRKLRVGYVGTVGEAHALETFIEAAALLSDNSAFEFVLAGGGSRLRSLRRLAETKNLNNLHFISNLNSQNRNIVLSDIDIGIVTLKKDPLFETVIPSKIFDYAAAKLPILIGVEGEAKDIVESSKLGFSFEPENASDLVARLIDIKDGRLKFCNTSHDQFVQVHSRDKIAKQISDFIVDS